MTRKNIADQLARALPPLADVLDPSRNYLGAVAEGIQRAFERFEVAIDADKTQKFLATAEDENLVEWGKRYKTLGKRRGRGEEEFRRFLRGIVAAYQGQGRAQDIRTAIGAGILTSADAFEGQEAARAESSGAGPSRRRGGPIELTGYPETLEYDVTIHDHAWNSHPGELIVDLARFADASVVSLRSGVEYRGRLEGAAYGQGGRIVKQNRDVAGVEYGQGERQVIKNYDSRLTGEERFPTTEDTETGLGEGGLGEGPLGG